MILYRKVFPLGKGVSLSRYIEALEQGFFPPYTLLIHEIPGTQNYHIEIILTNLFPLSGWHNAFSGGVLFNECTVEHSKDDGFFTLQASMRTINFLIASFYGIGSLMFFLGALSIMLIKGGSGGGLFVIAILTLLFSAPTTLTYTREKKFLEKIGSLALELNKE